MLFAGVEHGLLPQQADVSKRSPGRGSKATPARKECVPRQVTIPARSTKFHESTSMPARAQGHARDAHTCSDPCVL